MRISLEFVDAVERSGLSMLDRIISMDETLVSYFTPETKRMSKEWTLKGKPGPLKAKVQASRSKQMVFVFFDLRGLIYTHIASKSATINAPYVVNLLGKFWRSLRLKRPELLSQETINTPGRESPGVSPPSTSLPPSEAGWSAAKSASVSAASLSKNPKK